MTRTLSKFSSRPSATSTEDTVSRRGRRHAEAALLLLLVGIAVWLWTRPLRAERTLKRASLQELQAQAKREPDNPRLFYYQGVRLHLLGQNGPAAESFSRAASLDSDDEESWLAWAAVAGAAQGDQQSLSILTTYLQKHPQSAGGHLGLARLYEQKRIPARAYEEAQQAAKLNPHNADAWRLMGTAALTAQRPEEAETAMRHAVRENSRDWRNQVGLGNVLLARRQQAAAEACLREAAHLAPQESLPLLALGSAQLSHAHLPVEVETARQNLLRAAAMDTGNAALFAIIGQTYVRDGRWTEARDALLHAESLDPNNAETHFALARVYRNQGNVVAANAETAQHQRVKSYEMAKLDLGARARAGDDKEARLKLARLLTAHGEYALAADTYSSLLAHDPGMAIAREELSALQKQHGDALTQSVSVSAPITTSAVAMPDLLRDADAMLAQQHYKEAESAYRSLLAHDPNGAAANQGLGLVLDGLGNTDDAFLYLNRAVRADPHLTGAKFALARIYYAAGFPDEAAKRLEEVVKEAPTRAEYWHELGIVYHDVQARYLNAEQAFQQALNLEPGNSAYLLDHADMLANMHKIELAEAEYRRALDLDQNNAFAQYRLAHFLLNHRPGPATRNEAERLLRQVVAAIPRHPGALFDLGKCALLRGDARQSIHLLERSLTLSPNVVAPWYELSRAYQQLGDAKSAEAARATFRELRDYYTDLFNTEEQAQQRPKEAILRLKLARLYAKGRQNAKAINQYQVCLARDPKNTAAHRELTALVTRLQANGEMPSMSVFNGMLYAGVKVR